MGILEIILLGIGLAMDACAASLANGLCEPDMKPGKTFMIAFSFGFFQAAMPLIGFFAGSLFADFLSGIIPWVALVLLSIIGVHMIMEGYKKRSCECPTHHIGVKMIIVQAIATSIDALMVGLLFVEDSVAQVTEYVLIIGGITLALSLIALRLGRRFANILRNGAEYVGGAILIGIGLKIFIEYLISIY
ncbi:MAG TPA: manganese efflux pump MntP family protein [Candidatus Izemoplasmatales bacterium]|mgnify:CR=1 FL=1|nr:manganese efflux pump MntP family protein [Candidatus Izemoplasmatales bacterium]